MRCLRLVDRDGNNYVIPKCIEEEDGGANRRLKRFSPWMAGYFLKGARRPVRPKLDQLAASAGTAVGTQLWNESHCY